MQKIKISTVSSKPESVQERQETQIRVEEERKHQIDVGRDFLHRSKSLLNTSSSGLCCAHHER